MKEFVKPEDYSRDWARGVCMNVERTTGVQPRPQRVWPRVVSIAVWFAVTAAIVGLAWRNA